MSEKEIKKTSIKVTASYVTKDMDGLKTKHVYVGSGETVQEALESLSNIETSEKFPKVNLLVNTRVEKGGNVIEKSLAPHKARAIFADKNADVFEAVYRGL